MCFAYSLITQIMSFFIGGLRGKFLSLVFFYAVPTSEKANIL